jgi:hypothetical protein
VYIRIGVAIEVGCVIRRDGDVARLTHTGFLTILEDAMAFQSAPRCAVAEVLMGTSGSTNWGPTLNALTFQFADDYDQGDLDNLANSVAAWWAAEMMITLSADVQLNQVHVRGLNSELDLEALATITLPVAGGVGANVMPANVAAVVRFGTGFTGRSARGRSYIAGIAVTGANDDDLTSTVRDAILDAFLALPTYLSVGVDHVVISRFHNGALRSPDAITLLINSYSFSSNQVATQQRRLHRYG